MCQHRAGDKSRRRQKVDFDFLSTSTPVWAGLKKTHEHQQYVLQNSCKRALVTLQDVGLSTPTNLVHYLELAVRLLKALLTAQ